MHQNAQFTTQKSKNPGKSTAPSPDAFLSEEEKHRNEAKQSAQF